MVIVCFNEVVVVKDLINSRKYACTYFKHLLGFLFRIFFRSIFYVCMQRTWMGKVHLI